MSAVTPATATTAHVVLAVKDLVQAKTRLAEAVPTEQRAALVLAMLTDTLGVALRSPEVTAAHVVTRDPAVAAAARSCGAAVLADPESEGLNHALEHAAAILSGQRVVALQPDLPALRTGELTAALASARSRAERCFVADRQGTGTTLLTGIDGTNPPLFGGASAARHQGSGAERLAGLWPGLRCDVDTVADLAAALQLGVGAATGAVIDRWGTAATVAEHSGGEIALRTDDGRLIRCDEAAAQLAGWRQLRPGQRVRVHPGRDGAALLLTVAASTPPG
jgi:2-phospho-L-lactate guanylyltransferase